MRVLHVISSLTRDGGGPSRSAQGLVAGLNCAGIDTWLMTLTHGDEPWVEGVQNFVNGGVFENVVTKISPNIVHLHGLWNPKLHRCAVICRRLSVPYVIAPRGMLEPWSLKQKWLKKRIARFLYQDYDLKCAAALHATAESEAEHFRTLGFKNPVIISANGVNLPKNFSRVERVDRVERRALFVSRMHPKKGVLELVDAWSRLGVRSQGLGVSGWKCELVYTVSGELEKEYEAKVMARVKELGLEDVFIFTGALDDEAKWEAYRRADLFVLPTYSENFGIVVAEALWAGVPVITTKGTPWSDLEGDIAQSNSKLQTLNSKINCGWWIDLPVESSNPFAWDALDEALVSAMTMSDDERGEMGECGHKLVKEKYTWGAVVKNMVAGYEGIICQGYVAN